MADDKDTKKDDDTGRKDVDDTTDDNDDDDDGDDDSEEKGWARLESIIDNAVEKRLKSWSDEQGKSTKTTSSRSPRRPEKKTPQRKRGFLSSQFFSGLNPDE